jgi:hypothetical protein
MEFSFSFSQECDGTLQFYVSSRDHTSSPEAVQLPVVAFESDV